MNKMSEGNKRTITIGEPVLKRNDVLASQLRDTFRAHNILVVNVLSSPGSGKTELLKKTALTVGDRAKMAVVVGDLATENDAKRIQESGITAVQIVTGDVCHLDSEMVLSVISKLDLDSIDILFIENVGNLVCPSSYDLGEDLRAVLLSCTEGEDKPLKYPSMFATADVVIVNKVDIAEILEFKSTEAERSITLASPHAHIIKTSAKTGEGVDTWINWLMDQLNNKRTAACRS